MILEKRYPYDLDLDNEGQRKIICIENHDIGYGHNEKNILPLKIGKIYYMTKIDVHNWYTNVYLKEFPTIPFNSVLFHEAIVQANIAMNEREEFFTDAMEE